MKKNNSKNKNELSIRNKHFDPKKYDMVVCPVCHSHGYIEGLKRRPCPKCGGFGFITKQQAN
jgi:DnaJ-class molecular chaperone